VRRAADDIARPIARCSALTPIRRAHTQLLEKRSKAASNLLRRLIPIARRWGATDYPELLVELEQNSSAGMRRTLEWGADLVQNILWRL